ncbi:MAG TPA: dual specificity protein phosphatase family protein [Ktedonobacteraceae bacterium]|nr:dual specificity protein phosphatase family protein [Ktedonobacteraceae bacterium]
MAERIFQELSVRSQLDPVINRRMRSHPLKFLSQYDLTFEEVKRLVLPTFTWIVNDKIAAMGFPNSDDAYTVLYKVGIRTIINLTGYNDDAPEIRMFRVHRIPIPNHKAPTIEQMFRATTVITESVKEGLSVLVHCEAGLGRTGTVLAAFFVTVGYDGYDAIETVRSKRAGSIETEEQEQSVLEFAEWFEKSKV